MSKKRRSRRPLFDLSTLVLLGAVLLLDPSNAFGRSPGLYGLFLILGLMGTAYVLASLAAHFVPGKGLKHHALTFALSLVFNYLGVVLVDSQWRAMDPVFQAKVEYFCLTNYKHDQCVRHVNVCPSCALHIDRWKRTKMAENLKRYRTSYSPALQAKLREKESQRKPAAIQTSARTSSHPETK